MDYREPMVIKTIECLRLKFHGLYHLLELRSRRAHGVSLQDLIARRLIEAHTILEELTLDKGIASLIARECSLSSCRR